MQEHQRPQWGVFSKVILDTKGAHLILDGAISVAAQYVRNNARLVTQHLETGIEKVVNIEGKNLAPTPITPDYGIIYVAQSGKGNGQFEIVSRHIPQITWGKTRR